MAGKKHSGSRDGRQPLMFGLEAAPASRSQPQDNAKASQTPDTSGPSSIDWSASAALQLSLESRLRVLLDGIGSPEYALTWRYWDMPSGPPILQRRALARRTSASGCTGWPTTTAQDAVGSGVAGYPPTETHHTGLTLTDAPRLSGWPTPDAEALNVGADLETHMARMALLKERHHNGNGAGLPLGIVAQLVGWNTPRATDGENGGPNQTGGALPHDAAIAGWQTPAVADGGGGHLSRGGARSGEMLLPGQAKLALSGCSSPTANDAKQGEASKQEPDRNLSGQTTSFSPASTGRRGVLNPAFSLWLMGFLSDWLMAAPQSKRPARSSSGASGTP